MIYYLCHYNCKQIADEKRIASLPGMNKMGYIISVLSCIENCNTMVVSPCETASPRHVKGSVRNINESVSVKTFDSCGGKNRIVRHIWHLITLNKVLRFLQATLKPEDTLVVYHSLALMNIVKKVKNATKCKLVLEVEEIYSDVTEDERLKKEEMAFFQIADKYVVITELLNSKINLHGKPYVVSNGTYRALPNYSKKFDDGKIHLVYAGSFNPVKGGGRTAIEAAPFLDENYVLHVLGKGSKSETDAIVARIEQLSQTSKCKIVYEGCKTDIEFDSFVQSCHIGLSTQQPDGKYNATSFPSKILMYMSNGLPVVSVRIPAVETSEVGDCIYYYDTPSPQSIAEAIKSVPLGDCQDTRMRLNELDVKFKAKIEELLN